MAVLLIIIHVIACIGLIMIVLLQTGKGADMGAAFGGGASQTLFGSSGAGTFFGKATTAIAVIFMLTSLTLAYISTRKTVNSVMMEVAPVEETMPESQGVPAPVEAPADQPAQTE